MEGRVWSTVSPTEKDNPKLCELDGLAGCAGELGMLKENDAAGAIVIEVEGVEEVVNERGVEKANPELCDCTGIVGRAMRRFKGGP